MRRRPTTSNRTGNAIRMRAAVVRFNEQPTPGRGSFWASVARAPWPWRERHDLLYRAAGLSYEQIGALRNVTRETVRQTINRACRRHQGPRRWLLPAYPVSPRRAQQALARAMEYAEAIGPQPRPASLPVATCPACKRRLVIKGGRWPTHVRRPGQWKWCRTSNTPA